MSILVDLWLPILIASILVFFASSLIHMITPWHKSDLRSVPDQEKARKAIGELGLAPGDYVLPRPDNMKNMNSPEFLSKLKEGPRLVFTVLPNEVTNMGKMLGAWFVYILAVSLFAGFFAGHVVQAGDEHRRIFHVVGAVTFMAYAGALCQMSIWWGRSWATTLRSMIDGLIYAAITAETFALMWPR